MNSHNSQNILKVTVIKKDVHKNANNNLEADIRGKKFHRRFLP